MKTASALVVAALVLTACSSPQATEPAHDGPPTWQATEGPARWTCSEVDVTHAIAVPTDMGDPRIRAVEDFRTKAGAEPVHYVLVEIDATQAVTQGPHGVWGAQWANGDQETVHAQRLLNTAMQWQGWSNNPGAKVPEVEVDANTGAKGWALLTTDAPVDSMTAPMVTTGPAQVPCERG